MLLGTHFLVFLVYLAIIAAVLYINYLAAKAFEAVAFQKGYGTEKHTFAWCFWLGIVGYLYVIALPDLVEEAKNERIVNALEKLNEKEKTENGVQ